MKKFAGLIAAATIVSSTAYAGGLDDAMMEKDVMAPETVVEESGSSAGDDWVFGLMMFAIIAGAAGG